MKRKISIDGYCYRLRPVHLSDAEFIIKIRLEDKERARYIHEIPADVQLERQWIEKYLAKDDDYFFVVEDKFLNIPVGLIAVYDIREGRAEWGRWIIQKGSMAAVESVYLLYKIAFRQLNLDELYCRTVEDNFSVVSFHTGTGLKTRTVLKDFFVLDGKAYNAVEQFIKKEDFENTIKSSLNQKCQMIFLRFLKKHAGTLEFHHLGIACHNIGREIQVFQMLGYQFENETFTDERQGIKGIFGTAPNQPKIELLENLCGSNTLTPYLDKSIKIYHYAYMVKDIEKAFNYFMNCHAKVISPLKPSAYFGKKICF